TSSSAFTSASHTVQVEWKSEQGYCADVAILKQQQDNSKDPVVIFEICHTHVTETQRPEPWFELDALPVCQYLLSRKSSSLSLPSSSSLSSSSSTVLEWVDRRAD